MTSTTSADRHKPAGELVDQEHRQAEPVTLHACDQVWHVGNLADATAATWRDDLADMLCAVAAQLRGEADPSPEGSDVDQP